MLSTFGLLAASICAVWIQPLQVGKWVSVPLWIVLFLASITSGLMAGYLTWPAIMSLAIFGTTAYAAKNLDVHRPLRFVLLLVTGAMALALSMHRFPGFVNPALVENMKFSLDAHPITHHVNFDKISVGLILMVLFCNPARRLVEWKDIVRRTIPVAAATLLLVLGLAVIVGYVKIDVKMTSYTAIFIVTNLLFTCVTEEAFFRGFMQEQLMRGMSGWRGGAVLAAAISAVLFGIAHIMGGPWLVLLAAIAGLCYAYAYLLVRRVEAAILTHFSLNAVHFVAFTYPSLIKG